jgi:hypothetical protein
METLDYQTPTPRKLDRWGKRCMTLTVASLVMLLMTVVLARLKWNNDVPLLLAVCFALTGSIFGVTSCATCGASWRAIFGLVANLASCR